MTATPDTPAIAPAPTESIWRGVAKSFLYLLVPLVLILLAVAAIGAASDQPDLAGNVLTLALPAFLAGVLSIMSPCSLPLVFGYFGLAVQEQGNRIGQVTVAFLAGVGTTMAIIGAGFTALGSLAVEYQRTMATVGGVIVICFGVMSLLGRGFGGARFANRPAATTGGAYLYGLIFALGWTTCVGPILGSILTLLLTSGGSTAGALSLVAGAALSLIYVLGLGLPILLLVTALQVGSGASSLTRVLKGKGWEVTIFGRTLYLHSTSVISGIMLVILGILLLTGTMATMSEQLAGSRLSQFGVEVEEWVNGLFR